MGIPIARLSVEETKIFVSQYLHLPYLAQHFEEQEVDGAALLDLTTATIREFLPSLTIGKCHKFFNSLKSFQISDIELIMPVSESQSSSSPLSPTCPRSPSPPPPFDVMIIPDQSERSLSPDSPLCQTPAKDCPPASTQNLTPTSARTRTNSPVLKHFPIEKLMVTSIGMQMINSGEYTLVGKSAITTAVITLMHKYSPSDCYASFTLKSLAATALEMGLGTKAAIDAWHKAFTTKLSNWRKRCKVVDPAKTDTMKEKYKKQAQAGRHAMDAHPSSGVKIKLSTFQGALSEEEIVELNQRKQIIITEYSKPPRERNQRYWMWRLPTLSS